MPDSEKTSDPDTTDEAVKTQGWAAYSRMFHHADRLYCAVYHWENSPDGRVLDDFSLRVPANSTIALVGASGSGNFTIVGLMERWYEPESEIIKIDGRDVRDLDVQWLRTQVRFAQQEPVLFNATIYQNVRLCLVGAADLPENEIEARVVQACRDANADDFIRDLPSGYQTIVGERASMLSGGQKQRIAIARSIISNPNWECRDVKAQRTVYPWGMKKHCGMDHG